MHIFINNENKKRFLMINQKHTKIYLRNHLFQKLKNFNSIVYKIIIRMTNIAELYQQLLIPDNKVIEQTTKALLEKYQDADSISEILEALKDDKKPVVRRHAAIGLKTILHNFWYGYSSSSSAEDIINEIISCLKNESETFIRHLIVYALEPICKYRNVAWPQMIDDLAFECIQSEDQEVLDLGLSLYEMNITYLDEGTRNEILQPLSEKIQEVFQSQSELIPTSSNLIASLVKIFNPPIPECLKELIEMLFAGFKELLANQYPLIYKIANNLSKVVLKESTSSSAQHLKFLIEIANDESISPLYIYHIFTPIYSIIRKKFMEPEIYQLVPVLLPTIFKCSALSFQDDCITEQSNSLYIFNSIDSIPKYDEEDGSSLFACFSEHISDSSVEHSFASLLVFQFFIDNYPHIIADNLKQTATFLIQQSNGSNHHCLIEQSMICLYHLINVFTGGLVQYINEILETIMNSISSDHEQVVVEALNAITELLKSVDFNHTLIPTILELLINAMKKSADIMNGCFFALNALVFGAGTDIAPYSSQIAPVFIEMIHMNENLYPLAKSNASESIAQLLKNVPDKMEQFSEESMQLLIEQCSSSEDLSDVCNVLSAFSILVHSQAPKLQDALQVATEKSVAILQLDLPQINNPSNEQDDEDENEDDDLGDSIPVEYEAKKAAMNFINELVIVHPDAFTSNASDFLEILVHHINECYEPETREIAIKTITTFSIANLIEPMAVFKEFFESDLLNDDDYITVEKCFSSIRKILTPQIPVEIVSECIRTAIKGLKNRLYCQESEDIDNYELEHSIFKFLSKVAQTHTAVYPFKSILKIYEGRSKRDDASYFMSLAVYSLSNYLIEIKKQGIQSPPKIEEIFQIIFESLSICNGKDKPFPLLAVKELFRNGVFELSANFLEPTFQALNVIVQIENDGQPTYNETMSAAASLLFVLFKMLGDGFDVATYLKFMVSVLPSTFKFYSQDIYTLLIELFQKYTQAFEQLVPQVISGLAQTLVLSDRSLNSAGLSSDNINQIVEFFKVLITAPESQQIIEEALSNQNEVDMLTQRLKK